MCKIFEKCTVLLRVSTEPTEIPGRGTRGTPTEPFPESRGIPTGAVAMRGTPGAPTAAGAMGRGISVKIENKIKHN